MSNDIPQSACDPQEPILSGGSAPLKASHMLPEIPCKAATTCW